MLNRTRLKKSFSYALEGLVITYKEELNFRLHILAALGVVFLALFLGCTKIEWILLVGAIFSVFTGELINSAVEHCVDITKPRISDVGKKIKDTMAAVVFILSLNACFVGFLIFIPKIIAFSRALIG